MSDRDTKKAQTADELQEILRVSEIRYRRLFERAQDGILILDAESGQIIDVNPFLVELLGYSHDQFINKTIWDIGFFKDIIANKDNFDELKSKGYIRYEDLPLETADGRKIDVEFVSNVYKENINYVIQCNIRNISERKHIEQELARHAVELTIANEKLQAFAYAIAHDLRNPITAIKGLSDTINRLYSKNIGEKVGDLLTRISGSAVKMNEIIDGLLLLYTISRDSITMEEVDISVIAITIINELRESQPNRTVEFITRGNLKVHGDSKLITIMLSNLIRNAWKFTGKTANPRIELFECPDKSICLKDNGVGFDMAKADEIFIAFKRLHGESDFEGTGLGLAIVHQVIDRHNGKIWAKGEPGKGAEIYFTLG
jgi:PAS domain S-box-containing protein